MKQTSRIIIGDLPFEDLNPHLWVDSQTRKSPDHFRTIPLNPVLNISKNRHFFKFQVAPSDYRDIITAVTSIFYVRCHGCFNKSLYVLPIGSALITMLLLLIVALALSSLDAFVLFGLPMLIIILPLAVIYKMCTLKVSIKYWDIIPWTAKNFEKLNFDDSMHKNINSLLIAY